MYYKLTIPEPCHENWDTMNPVQQGRFCSSCAKTVIDFTAMPQTAIEEYLLQHQSESVCGRVKQEHLGPIKLEVPAHILTKKYSFARTFMLALLLVMGTTLFSCDTTAKKGTTLEEVCLVDSTKISSSEKIGKTRLDTVCTTTKKEKNTTPAVTEKEETPKQGNARSVASHDNKKVNNPLVGEVAIIPVQPLKFSLESLDKLPEFPDTPEGTRQEKLNYFNSNARLWVARELINGVYRKNPNYRQDTESYKLITELQIDTLGNFSIKAVQPSTPEIEKSIKLINQNFPCVVPGEKDGKKVIVNYSLPVTIKVD